MSLRSFFRGIGRLIPMGFPAGKSRRRYSLFTPEEGLGQDWDRVGSELGKVMGLRRLPTGEWVREEKGS